MIPRVTSGKFPNNAFSDAILISHANAISKPPPRAKPLILAITGKSNFSNFSKAFFEQSSKII